MAGVEVSNADQCMYGLKTWGPNGRKDMHAKKPTKFMTNCAQIKKELQKKCDGQHKHQTLMGWGGRAKWAARYPPELCRAICMGLAEAIEAEKLHVKPLFRVSAVIERQDSLKRDAKEWHEEEKNTEGEWKQAWDDVTGKMLDHRIVREARKEQTK